VTTSVVQPRAISGEEFARRITKICRDDPGRRAQLRRGLRLPPERALTMHAVVAPLLPDKLWPEEERAFYAVAAMIADQVRPISRTGAEKDQLDQDLPDQDQLPEGSAAEATTTDERPRRAGNFGASLAAAVRAKRRTGDGLGLEAAEKRLHLLVRQDLDGVHRQLPGLVRHVWSTTGRGPDWPRLLADLGRWRRDRDLITKTWLQSFYRGLPTDIEADPDNDDPTPAKDDA
jgi:CRISPR system Cascade subunit CasB